MYYTSKSQGISGFPGEKGDPGLNGRDGVAGLPGLKGEAGEKVKNTYFPFEDYKTTHARMNHIPNIIKSFSFPLPFF